MNLTTVKFDLVHMASGSYKLFCFDKNLCRRMNECLGEYPADYIFRDGDEAIFHFPSSKLIDVKIALKIKG